MMDDVESLHDAHYRRLEALLSRDGNALRQVVAEDMLYVSPMGVVQSRADVLKAMADGDLVVERMDSYDLQTRINGHIGVLIYAAEGRTRIREEMVEGKTRSTTIYQRRDGRWMMISQHQSSLK